MMKICAKCKIDKPKSEYHPRPSKKVGVRSRCISCENEDRALLSEYSKEYRLKKKEEKKEYDKKYRIDNAEKIIKQKKEGYQANKQHYLSYRKKWARSNPDNQAAISRNSAGKRKQRTRGGITATDLRLWAASKKKECYWCGRKKLSSYEIDHYEPLARGGKHELSSLVIACMPCNRRKSSSDPYEFAAKVGRLF